MEVTRTKDQKRQLLKTFLRDISQKSAIDIIIDEYLNNVKPVENLKKINEIPFSSQRKFNACIYQNYTLILGAPEILLEKNNPVISSIKRYEKDAYQVLVFGTIIGKYQETDDQIKKKFQLLAIILIEDAIRREASSTLNQLAKENIHYRIISGDSPETVTAIAKKINPQVSVKIISGNELDSLNSREKEKAILENIIFASVKPEQKKEIVNTLKKNKLFTIMVGDGANDVLALQASNLGVAMSGSSSMAKDVADIVLLNNSFTTLPEVLYEGRRILTNIQTIASIYLIKNISYILTIFLFLMFKFDFPFNIQHIQLSSFLIIGIPSFFLAFEKHNFKASDEGFIQRLLLFSGIIGIGNTIIHMLIFFFFHIIGYAFIYERSLLLTVSIFLGISNVLLIYRQHYSIQEILQRKKLITILCTILILFFATYFYYLTRNFFRISDISIIDIFICAFFSIIGFLCNLLVLKQFHLIKYSEKT